MAKFYILVFIIYSAIFVTSEEEKEVNLDFLKKCTGKTTVAKECFDKFTQQDKDAGYYCCNGKLKKKDGVEGGECTSLEKELLDQLSVIEASLKTDEYEELHIICEETSSNSNYLLLGIFSLLLLILL